MYVIKLNQMCDDDMGNIYIYLTSAFLCTEIFWKRENFVTMVAIALRLFIKKRKIRDFSKA